MKRALASLSLVGLLALPSCKKSQDASTPGAAAKRAPASVPGYGKPGQLYPVLKGGKYGYIDHAGNIVIEPKFAMAYRFSEGLALVANEKNKAGYIDIDGKQVIDFKYDGATPFSEGLATVWVGPKAGVINKKGEMVIEPRFDRVGKFSDGLAPAVITRERGPMKASDGGYIDPTGAFVIYPQFDPNLTIFSEGLAGVRRLGQLWSFIDRNDKTVLKTNCFLVGHFSEGLAGAMNEASRWGYIDKTGKWAITPRFARVRFFSEGLAGVLPPTGNKWGFIDKTGTMVIKEQFDAVDQFLDGIAMVQVGKKVGYIDKTGKYVWPLTE